MVPTRFLAPIDCSKTPALKKVIEKKEAAKPLGIREKKTAMEKQRNRSVYRKIKRKKCP